MGRIEEVVDPAEALNDAMKLKDAGNEAFKKQQWEDAIECYSKAIGLVPEDSKDKAVFLKNRAATYLKTEQFEEAVSCNFDDLFHIHLQIYFKQPCEYIL